MLSIFPELLTYQLLAPFIIRVVLGFLFLNLGYLKLHSERKRWEFSFSILNIRPTAFWVSVLGLVQIIGGIALVVGAYTQLVALVFTLITVAELNLEYKQEDILKRSLPFYLLLAAACSSLLFSGAGFFAIDLPL